MAYRGIDPLKCGIRYQTHLVVSAECFREVTRCDMHPLWASVGVVRRRGMQRLAESHDGANEAHCEVAIKCDNVCIYFVPSSCEGVQKRLEGVNVIGSVDRIAHQTIGSSPEADEN